MNTNGTTGKLGASLRDFKVGDKVTLREDSKFNVGGPSNPVGVEGYISDIGDDDWIHVEWENRYCNSYGSQDLDLVEKKDDKKESTEEDINSRVLSEKLIDKKHNHYYKDVSNLEYIDVYRVLKLFNITDPCVQHAVKKQLCAGGRGVKDVEKDYQEAIDSLTRALEMMREDNQ